MGLLELEMFGKFFERVETVERKEDGRRELELRDRRREIEEVLSAEGREEPESDCSLDVELSRRRRALRDSSRSILRIGDAEWR